MNRTIFTGSGLQIIHQRRQVLFVNRGSFPAASMAWIGTVFGLLGLMITGLFTCVFALDPDGGPGPLGLLQAGALFGGLLALGILGYRKQDRLEEAPARDIHDRLVADLDARALRLPDSSVLVGLEEVRLKLSPGGLVGGVFKGVARLILVAPGYRRCIAQTNLVSELKEVRQQLVELGVGRL